MSVNFGKEDVLKKVLMISIVVFIFYQFFTTESIFYQINNAIKNDYLIYSHVEESYIKITHIRVKYPLAGRKSREVDGRFTGNFHTYYAIGYDLKDTTEIVIKLPSPKEIDQITYDTKYDTLFPFLTHVGTIKKDKKTRKGLATTNYIVASDSILPIWRPKNAEKTISKKEWKFRYKKDDKVNWYKKWGQRLLLSILFVITVFFLKKKIKK